MDIPLSLYRWELELIVNRPKKWHIHDWRYRGRTGPEGLSIMDDSPRLEYRSFPWGRYCSKCGCVDFALTMRKARHKAPVWTQDDLNYLLGSLMRPEPVSRDSEGRER